VAWIVALGLVAFVVYSLVSAGLSRRLLVLDVARGKVARLGGRAPAELVSDIEDILARSGSTGRIIVQLESSRAIVRAEGSFDEATKQRLRNVVGRFPVARLRAARRVKRG